MRFNDMVLRLLESPSRRLIRGGARPSMTGHVLEGPQRCRALSAYLVAHPRSRG